ncbi:hypothetical protein Tco_0370781, partial [Tanacetum coccineum]
IVVWEESLKNEDVLVTLISRVLKKRTGGTKEETSDGLYVRGRSDLLGKAPSGGSSRIKSRVRTGKLHASDVIQRGNAYFGEALLVVENDEKTQLVMDSGHALSEGHGSKQVGFTQLGSKQVGFKQLGHKQVGFKQLGFSVETGIHGAHVHKRVWFEVELQGDQGNREAKIFQVHLGIKAGANIMVIGVPRQEGIEGNVAEKKKVKESIEANLEKLLKYNAWSTRWSLVRVYKWELLNVGTHSSEVDVWPDINNLADELINLVYTVDSYPQEQKKRKQNCDKLQTHLREIIYKRIKSIEMGEGNCNDLLGILLDSNLKESEEHGVGMSMEDVI